MMMRVSKREPESARRGARPIVRELTFAALDDATLYARIVDGHPAAGAAAWDRYARLVRSLLRRTLGPSVGPDEIEDLTQESFLRLFRHIDELRSPSALGSFVIGITLRVARTELRRRRVRRILSFHAPETLPEQAVPSSDDEARRALRRLYGILDQLSTEARLVFVLRYLQGLELTEVARTLGVSLATAKRHIARATDVVLAQAQRDPALAPYVGVMAREGGA